MGDDAASGAAIACCFSLMAHQVGGHATPKTSLRSGGGKVLKPFQSQARGDREFAFYQRVFEVNESLQDAALLSLVPRFYGVEEVQDDDSNKDTLTGVPAGKYLVLEDITFGRAAPCIMDVKVGTRSYEDGASAAKIAYERSKFAFQEALGFRVQGIKVFDTASRSYIEFDKHVGRSITDQAQVAGLFAKFFPMHNPPRARQLLQQFLHRLDAFQRWFEQQTTMEFLASSLLFVYDGDISLCSDRSDDTDLRLIDFAHIQFPDPPRVDDGVLLGIRSLSSIFQALLEQLPPPFESDGNLSGV